MSTRNENGSTRIINKESGARFVKPPYFISSMESGRTLGVADSGAAPFRSSLGRPHHRRTPDPLGGYPPTLFSDSLRILLTRNSSFSRASIPIASRSHDRPAGGFIPLRCTVRYRAIATDLSGSTSHVLQKYVRINF